MNGSELPLKDLKKTLNGMWLQIVFFIGNPTLCLVRSSIIKKINWIIFANNIATNTENIVSYNDAL